MRPVLSREGSNCWGYRFSMANRLVLVRIVNSCLQTVCGTGANSQLARGDRTVVLYLLPSLLLG